jgi:hypothetical protein
MKNLKRLKDWYAGLMKEQKKSVHVTVFVILFELALFVWCLIIGWTWAALIPLAFFAILVFSAIRMVKSFNALNETLRRNREILRKLYEDFE